MATPSGKVSASGIERHLRARCERRRLLRAARGAAAGNASPKSQKPKSCRIAAGRSFSQFPSSREEPLRPDQMGTIQHLAIEADDAGAGIGLEQRDDLAGLGQRLRQGEKISLIGATCAGWIAILPVKPSRRAAKALGSEGGIVAEIGEDGVDRVDLGCARGEERQRAGKAIGVGVGAVLEPVGLGAEIEPRGPRRPRSAPSGDARSGHSCRGRRCPCRSRWRSGGSGSCRRAGQPPPGARRSWRRGGRHRRRPPISAA
ncbi:hypothetical protein BTHI11S_01065 [Bosea thiooxidans]